MNIADLQTLGITREDLVEKLVEKMAHDLMREEVEGYDPECGPYTDDEPTPFAGKIHALLVARIDTKVKAIADNVVAPRVDTMIENITLQKTNEWGEKRGESMSFVEYLVDRADKYLEQKVDHEGKPASGYGRNEQTRLTHMVHEYLHYSIATAMKEAMKLIADRLQEDLKTTVEMKLKEIAAKIQVAVRTQ